MRGATTRHIQRFARTFYFNPRAPCGARRSPGWVISSTSIFQPTRPLRGATNVSPNQSIIAVFQPTRPLRGATYNGCHHIKHRPFQPTRPLRGATIRRPACLRGSVNFNPRAPCGARLASKCFRLAACFISTHAPLAGRDKLALALVRRLKLISTHAPLAGRDAAYYKGGAARRISTHAPLAGRDWNRQCSYLIGRLFQPTRPLRGATASVAPIAHRSYSFQPTRPLRGATVQIADAAADREISTHAPLAGRDDHPVISQHVGLHFNPRAPCGARQQVGFSWGGDWKFQPTRPLRGATRLGSSWLWALRYFNPRAPCGARRHVRVSLARAISFQPTRPLRGATVTRCLEVVQLLLFQPTRPLRGATNSPVFGVSCPANFNPRAPCGARRYHYCRAVCP